MTTASALHQGLRAAKFNQSISHDCLLTTIMAIAYLYQKLSLHERDCWRPLVLLRDVRTFARYLC